MSRSSTQRQYGELFALDRFTDFRFKTFFCVVLGLGACGGPSPQNSNTPNPTSATNGGVGVAAPAADEAAGPGGAMPGTAGVGGGSGSRIGSAGTVGGSAPDASMQDVDAAHSTNAGTSNTKDAAVPECQPTDRKCSGLDAMKCVAGTWAHDQTCPYVCAGGSCTGTCVPTTQRCAGLNAQTCDSTGAWKTDSTCSYMCSSGVCIAQPVDPCTANNGGCGNATYFACTNNGGTAACASKDLCSTNNGGCNPSFYTCSNNTGAAPSCIAKDLCLIGNGGCDATYYTCSNNVGAAPSCIPKDLCATANPCDLNFYTCSNNVGAVPSCIAKDLCSTANPCSNLATCTNHTGSASTCACPSGYTGNGVGSNGCTDINECLGNPCTGNTNCNNTPGSYTCSCKPGFSGASCTDINECAANTDNCTTAQTCWNTIGSFTCNACATGSASCDGVDGNGCEVNTNGDLNNCGSCGHVCPGVAGANATCSAGVCGFTCTGSHFDCDGQASNGCEADVSSDGNNCGVCGHSCCGGTCGSGTCGVYDLGLYPYAYEVDQNNLYWSSGAALNQQPRLGGTSSVVVDTSASNISTTINDIKVDGTNIYWSQSKGGIFSVAIVGSGSNMISYSSASGDFTVVSNHGAINNFGVGEIGALALDATRIIWNAQDDPNISWKPKSSPNANATRFSVGPSVGYSPWSFVSDDTNLYVSPRGGRLGMHRSDLATGTGSDWITSTSTNYNFGLLSIDRTNVYYPFFNAVTQAETGIWKKAIANGAGPGVQLVSDRNITSPTATDGSFVYYFTAITSPTLGITGYQLRKVSVNGGSSQLIATTSKNAPGSPKVVASCLYWGEGGALKVIAVNP